MENCLVILVGNKNDLEKSRQVTYDEANKYASIHAALYMETSAKTGKNINELFEEIPIQIRQHAFLSSDQLRQKSKNGRAPNHEA